MALVQKPFSDLITFTRAGGGGRTNAQGQYEWLPANTPRIDYDPVTGECLGLLIEEQRTNLLTYSSDFANAAWSKTNCTVAASAAMAPDGTVTASKLIMDDGVNPSVPNGTGLSQGRSMAESAYTYSIFAKAAEHNLLRFREHASTGAYLTVDLTNGTIVNGNSTQYINPFALPVGDGWFWVGFTTPVTTTSANKYGLRSGQVGDGTSGIYIWGAQLEAGAFPTSYIPTTNAQVTRAADIASVNELSPWYNPEQWTLFVEAGMSSPNLREWRRVLELAASGSSYIASFQTNNANGLSIYSAQDGVARTVVGSTSRGSNNKMAVAWDAGSLSGAINGGAPASLSLPRTVTPVSLHIGGSIMANYAWSGHIRSIRYYPKRLSGSQLQALTA